MPPQTAAGRTRFWKTPPASTTVVRSSCAAISAHARAVAAARPLWKRAETIAVAAPSARSAIAPRSGGGAVVEARGAGPGGAAPPGVRARPPQGGRGVELPPIERELVGAALAALA